MKPKQPLLHCSRPPVRVALVELGEGIGRTACEKTGGYSCKQKWCFHIERLIGIWFFAAPLVMEPARVRTVRGRKED